MKIYKVGDSQKAVCEFCKAVKPMTLKLSDVPFSDGNGIVKNVLAGVCDDCGSTGFIPQQSVPMVKKQLDVRRKPLESRVPAHMVDILNLASNSVGAGTDFSATLIKYFIHQLSQDEKSALRLSEYLKSNLATGTSQKRLSLKGRVVFDELNTIKNKAQIYSTTDAIKAVVLKINEDMLINPKPDLIKELRGVAAAFS